MYELTFRDRESLAALVETTDFKLGLSVLELYLQLDGEDLDAETEKHLKKVLACEDHWFETYATMDNSYDNVQYRYVICTKCRMLLCFTFNRDNIITKSIIIDEKVYADF